MERRPHILLITSDQHRADTLGCAGHPCVRTPHLDQLAYEGVRFENAYSDCPVCIPARTTLITGIQSHRYGMPAYAEHFRLERARERFLGSLITHAGYQTHLVGKTHWHADPTFRAGFECVVPLSALGRERALRTGRRTNLTGLGGNEMATALSQFPPDLYSTDWIVDRCLEFLDLRERGQPFFLWASFRDPHPPFVIHEPYHSMYDGDSIPRPVVPAWVDSEACPRALYVHRWAWNSGPLRPAELRKARAVYYGMVTNLDHQLGRLFGQLMADGLWDDTLVVYTTDHGDMLGDLGDVGKTTFFEGSARIPFVVRLPPWLPTQPGRVNTELVELADLLPTFCELAGAPAPDDITGRSLAGVLRGEADRVRDSLHGQHDLSHMFRDGRFKYLYGADDGSELLFDVLCDRYDEHNLAVDPGHQELLAGLRRRFIAHLAEEGHDHLVNGRLLDKQLPRPSLEGLRARNTAGWWVAVQ